MATQQIYKEHTITVTDDLQFQVTGPEFDDDHHGGKYDTAQKARDAIDHRTATAAKQKVAIAQIAIPMIGHTGAPYTVRGINRTDRGLLTDPKRKELPRWGVKAPFADALFPPEDWIREDLTLLADLHAKREALIQRLSPFATTDVGGYGRVDPADYDEHIEVLKGNLAAKAAAAAKGRPE